jgi:hypothetical protein
MDTQPTETVAVHVAVLADTNQAGDDRLCAVLTYDGSGRAHLHQLTSGASAHLLHDWLEVRGERQLQLPFTDELPAASSSGQTWRTWVLPSVPICLRTLPPERLAAAFADRLCGEVVA